MDVQLEFLEEFRNNPSAGLDPEHDLDFHMILESLQKQRQTQQGAVLAALDGREADYIPTPSGHRLLATHLGRCLDAFSAEEVSRVQLLHAEPALIRLRILPGPQFGPTTEERLVRAFLQPFFADTGIRLETEVVSEIRPTATGKKRFYVPLPSGPKGSGENAPPLENRTP